MIGGGVFVIVAAIISAFATLFASTGVQRLHRRLAQAQARMTDAQTERERLDTAAEALRMYDDAVRQLRELSDQVEAMRRELADVAEFVRNVRHSAPQIGVHVSPIGVLSVLPGAPILVADDDPAIAQAIKLWLEEDNYDVTAVTTADAAIAAIAGKQFAVVILDLWLDGQSAIPVAEAIRSSVTLKPTQILLVTGASDQASKALIEAIDPVATIYKPFEFPDIGAAVRTALSKRESGTIPLRGQGLVLGPGPPGSPSP